MANTDFEDIQIERIKRFWRKFGNWILTILLVLSAGYAAWTYYDSHRMNQAYEASAVYNSMLEQQNNPKQLMSMGNKLMKKYPDTVYAEFAALILAKQYVSQNNHSAAKNSLKWVIEHADTPTLKIMATQRLARVLIAQDQPGKALDILDKLPEHTAYAPLINYVKGQAYLKSGNQVLAKKYWEKTLQLMAGDEAPSKRQFREYVQMRLSSLGVDNSSVDQQAVTKKQSQSYSGS